MIVTATARADTTASYSNASSGVLSDHAVAGGGSRWEGKTTPDDCADPAAPKDVLGACWSWRRPQLVRLLAAV